MPRISVVVPVYDVEDYLAACLQSLVRQTYRDLEVVVVDDGSTDGSAEIAERFCASDRRVRVVRQANAGLGAARNAGAAVATGELLAFADSDDLVVPDAYERLAAALDATGSAFASGNVLRFSSRGTAQAAFLARTFARTRLRTHVTRFRALLADRTAWNKLWRRSFWDEHGLRFPEGVLHEDIPVTVPAHFMAPAVDVLAEPVYLYRTREGGERSITQRRLELRVLRDRLAAVEHAGAYLAAHGPRGAKRWYDERLVADDLRLHLNLLDEAGADYRALFMDRVNAYLDDASPAVFDALPAIDRLKWQLVRRGRTDELVEVVRFAKERAADTPPRRRRGRWYGDYPYLGDPRLAIPRSTYRLGRRDQELALTVHLDELRRDGDRVVLRGHGALNGLSVAGPDDQRLDLRLVPDGRWRPVRMRVGAARLPTAAVRRSELGGGPRDLSWSGFEAVLDTAALGRTDAAWELCAHVRAGSVSRHRMRFAVDAPERLAAVHVRTRADALVTVAASADGAVSVRAATRWAGVTACRLDAAGVLVLSGALRCPAAGDPALELVRRSDGRRLACPVVAELLGAGGDPVSWRARLRLAEVAGAAPPLQAVVAPQTEPTDVWELWLVGGAQRLALALIEGAGREAWRAGSACVALAATPAGAAALVLDRARPRVLEAPHFDPAPAGRPLVALPRAPAARDRLAAADWDG